MGRSKPIDDASQENITAATSTMTESALEVH